jgi:hypothetical protein
MSMARVIARWVDDPTVSPMAVDLAIDDERRIVGPSVAFGCIDWEGARRPFTLDEAGLIDFGTGATWRTDLRQAAMRVGATFRIDWGQGDEGVYRIVKIAIPGARA